MLFGTSVTKGSVIQCVKKYSVTFDYLNIQRKKITNGHRW